MTTAIPTAALTRPLADSEREAYVRDGAAVRPGILPMDWVDALREATDRLIGACDPIDCELFPPVLDLELTAG